MAKTIQEKKNYFITLWMEWLGGSTFSLSRRNVNSNLSKECEFKPHGMKPKEKCWRQRRGGRQTTKAKAF